MATVAPSALYGIYKLIDPYFNTNKIGGVVGDANHGSGYHLSREDLLRRGKTGDYSIQCPADKRGPSNAASGIDITFGSVAELITMHKRLLKACRENDPRIECVREVIGTENGKQVSGYNRVSTGSGSRSRVGYVASGFSDNSHLWHEHVSVLRDYCDDKNLMVGLAEVMAGVAPGGLGWKGEGAQTPAEPGTAPEPTPKPALPTYYVDPEKVSTFLYGIKHSTGEAVKERAPGYAITTGVAVITVDGRKWLLTNAGYRYALDYLTTTKPAPKPAPVPEKPKYLPTHYVDPAKVSTFLWGIRVDTGEPVKQRDPGFALKTGVEVAEINGRKWLVTEAGYRYALDYLTTTKPAVVVPPKAQVPDGGQEVMPTEVFVSANVRRSTADVKGYEWDKRKAACIAALRSTGGTVFAFQECTDEQWADISEALNLQGFNRGNVRVAWKRGVWTKLHDNYYRLDVGDDPRATPVVVIKHNKTGREFKVASAHLTNYEGGGSGGDGWRLGQAKALVDQVSGLDVLLGDFNDDGPVYTYLATRGLVDVRNKAEQLEDVDANSTHDYGKPTPRAGRWIDNALTRSSVKVKRAGLVMTGSDSAYPNASDHNFLTAEVVVSS